MWKYPLLLKLKIFVISVSFVSLMIRKFNLTGKLTLKVSEVEVILV